MFRTPNLARRDLQRALRFLAILLVLFPSFPGCQALGPQPLALSTDAQVTEALGDIAASGDTSRCADYGCGDLSCVPDERPPAELTKMSLPTYRIEPPDILLIDAIRVAPKSPYFIESLDIVQIVVSGTLPEQPIAGSYQVEPSGVVNLGPSYGPIKIQGLTTSEAQDAIERHLRGMLQTPEASVSLLQASGQQQIAGEHLVGPDGTINLGVYGSVYIAGLTIEQARMKIESHLSKFFDQPRVSVDVFAYNSKVYYIITEGAGFGDQVARIPITGNETVLDAIAQLGGLSQLSSSRIWISRPAPHGVGCDQILPVDWDSITRGANTCTNYQLLPGDRIFLAQDRLRALDGLISKVLNPVERVLGFTLLGVQTVQTINRLPLGFNQGFGN